MYEASLIDSVSIRGRMAFGVTCLQRVCHSWGVKGDCMRDLIDLLWAFVEQERLDNWEDTVTETVRHPSPDAFAAKFAFDHLDSAKRNFLADLVCLVVQIGRANLYCGYVNEATRTPTFRIALMLQSYLIPIPEIERFRQPLLSGGAGWGHPCSRTAFPA